MIKLFPNGSLAAGWPRPSRRGRPPWRFVLFANTRFNVGGLAYAPLSDNVFLRGVHFDANRLIGPSGKDVPGVRTLSYFIAHEITHNLVARELGIVKYWQLPAWKNEGYADLLAKGGDFDYEQAREQLRRNEKDLDPARSGLYLRYHLLVAYLLDHKGTSVADLLNRDFDQTRLEAEIIAPHGALEQSASPPTGHPLDAPALIYDTLESHAPIV